MMKKIIVLMLLAAMALTTSASGGIVLTEDFENPVVVGYDKAPPVPTGWVGANQGFGGSDHGLINLGDNQAYAFRYTNSGLTSAAGVIGVLESGQTYTISFDVRQDRSNTELGYSVQFAAFEAEVVRNDARESWIDAGNAVILASTIGSATDDGLWTTVSFDFTPDAVDNAASIGKDIGVRILGASSSALIDNVSVSAVPEPATMCLLGLGGLLLRRRR